ncbi:MAG: tRNA dihydrouridine(20/20a) synthase DusA [Rhizomicrobium sp.]
MHSRCTTLFAVAPMMEWTDSHCRVLHRLLTRRALLYTEMVSADAILHGCAKRLLAFDPTEHPVALQLGGAEPGRLALAARIAQDFGYDEINLNVGCPSDRVQSGRFGASLMREPALVGECVGAIRQAVAIPVTVKCRLGVDEQDPERALRELIAASAAAGVRRFAVHARKAWLKGLSPKENREIPPLDYSLVYAIKKENPELVILLNGGIRTLDEAAAHLVQVDGVMLGRAAYRHPMLLAGIDARFFGEAPCDLDAVLAEWRRYVGGKLKDGVRLAAMTRHMLGLFHATPGARLFRRHLSEHAVGEGAGLEVLDHALAFLSPRRQAA